MHRIETSLEIAAGAEQVWAVMLDFAAYPQWNPFIRRIEGKVQAGHRLSVTIEPPGRIAMRFAPRVLRCEPPRELRWRGVLLIPGLFDGEHYFLLESTGHGRMRLVHGEIFSGVLVRLLLPKLEASIRSGFAGMNEALRQRVLSPGADQPG